MLERWRASCVVLCVPVFCCKRESRNNNKGANNEGRRESKVEVFLV